MALLADRCLTVWDIYMTIRDTQKVSIRFRKISSTIRSATLIGYSEVARSVGLDPNRLMRKCGLGLFLCWKSMLFIASSIPSKRKNGVERLFWRLKGYRCIYSHFEKFAAIFLGFISFMLMPDGLRSLR